MDKREFLRLVASGEGMTVEFKAGPLHGEDIVRDVMAFANTRGGSLIFGVRDDGALVGLSEAEIAGIRRRIHRVADNLLTLQVRVERVDFDNLSFLVVHVPEAPDALKPLHDAHGAGWSRSQDRTVRDQSDLEPRTVPPRNTSQRRLSLFVAMSFRFEEEPALEDYYGAMVRAVKSTGLPIDLVRMDLEEGDYEITAEIEKRIKECDFVLADFTLNSLNVYFEAGIAVGAGKRIIRTARRGTIIPFDIQTRKILFYLNATQLERDLVKSLTAAFNEFVGDDWESSGY